MLILIKGEKLKQIQLIYCFDKEKAHKSSTLHLQMLLGNSLTVGTTDNIGVKDGRKRFRAKKGDLSQIISSESIPKSIASVGTFHRKREFS